jgi:hypothetical protein
MKQITFQKIERKRDFNYLYIVFGFLITVYFSFLMGISYGTPVTPSYNGYIMNFRGEKIKVVEDVKAEEVIISTRDWKPYEELTYKIFGEKDGKIAYAVMGCESNYKPNREHIDDKEASIGLMQINLVKGNGEGAWVHWDKVPGNNLEEKIAWLKVPENNLLIAKFIKGSSGFYPWTCFSKKGYLKYL